MIITEQPLV